MKVGLEYLDSLNLLPFTHSNVGKYGRGMAGWCTVFVIRLNLGNPLFLRKTACIIGFYTKFRLESGLYAGREQMDNIYSVIFKTEKPSGATAALRERLRRASPMEFPPADSSNLTVIRLMWHNIPFNVKTVTLVIAWYHIRFNVIKPDYVGSILQTHSKDCDSNKKKMWQFSHGKECDFTVIE